MRDAAAHAPAVEWLLSPGRNVEVVEWGGRGPSELTTLNALRILKAAGRLSKAG